MNKYLLLYLLVIISLLVPLSSAYFTPEHEFFNLKSFETVDSEITRQCSVYTSEVLDGNTAADVFVLFYFSGGKSSSYIFSHQVNSYNRCLELVGSDIQKRCFCYGFGSHSVQDAFSHNDGGLVPTYLNKYGASNFIGHMTVEAGYGVKFQKLKANDPTIKDGKLALYDKIVLNSLFEETGGNPELMTLLIDSMALEDVDVKNTVQVFRTGYLNEGFINSVYRDKLDLPNWMFVASGMSLLVGLMTMFLFLGFGTTRWRYMAAFFWLPFVLFGAVVLITFLMGNTWAVTNYVVAVPASLGYLSVSDADVIRYYEMTQAANDQFWKTGSQPFFDASGLTHNDLEGREVRGALINAENTFRYVLFPLMILILIGINYFLFIKSFGLSWTLRRKSKRR